MSNKLLEIEIVTPQKPIYKGMAISVNVPGSLLPFEILYNHAPIVSSLSNGIVAIKDETNKMLYFAISGGIIENINNKVSVIVEKAFASDEIEKTVTELKIKALKDEIITSTDMNTKNNLKSELEFYKTMLKAISYN